MSRHVLPVGGSGCGRIRMSADSASLSVEYDYFDNKGFGCTGSIEFDYVIAFRFRRELYSADFHDDSYDAIAEVSDSDWIKELQRIEPTYLDLNIRENKHFVLFFSNNGYLEVIARGFVEGLPKEGRLS